MAIPVYSPSKSPVKFIQSLLTYLSVSPVATTAETASAQLLGSLAAKTETVSSTSAITTSSPTAGVGYKTGAGGAVTQITSATTGVTLNKVCGSITTFGLTLTAGVDVSFTLTNSTIAATDVVAVSTKSYAGTADGIPVANVVATAAGSCVINIRNTGAATLDALAVLNFAVIKAVAA
jgi:hypothetical protein